MRRIWMLGLLPVALLEHGLGCAPDLARPAEVQHRQPDVPFVRTHDRVVDGMLDVAGVTGADLVYDLGCGDGRIVIRAARERGARGVGVDIEPRLIAASRENARKAGVADRVRFLERDLFETDVRDATVVTLYLLPEVNLKLRPKLLRELRPGARIVSHQFDMREWKPDRTVDIGGSAVHLWVVPARVEGTWAVRVEGAGPPQQGVLTLRQRFQEVSGSARMGGDDVPVGDVALRGAELRFSMSHPGGAMRFVGRVEGDTLQGTVAAPGGDRGAARSWTATRQPAGGGAPQP